MENKVSGEKLGLEIQIWELSAFRRAELARGEVGARADKWPLPVNGYVFVLTQGFIYLFQIGAVPPPPEQPPRLPAERTLAECLPQRETEPWQGGLAGRPARHFPAADTFPHIRWRMSAGRCRPHLQA